MTLRANHRALRGCQICGVDHRCFDTRPGRCRFLLRGRGLSSVLASRSMATFAIHSQAPPRAPIGQLLQIEILLAAAGVTLITALIPHRRRIVDPFLGILYVQITDPFLSQDVPDRWKHDDSSIGQCRQVLLVSFSADGVLDRIFPGLVREIRLNNVETILAGPHAISLAVQHDFSSRKIAFDARPGRNPHGSAVP